jgi:hypothetical protein
MLRIPEVMLTLTVIENNQTTFPLFLLQYFKAFYNKQKVTYLIFLYENIYYY